MSDSGNYIRSGSGVWKLAESVSSPSRTPVPSSTPSGVSRTPSRGLPQDPAQRAKMLAEQARVDLAKGQLSSAETNLRLALTFAPADAGLARELRAVVEAKELVRRAKPPTLGR
jgi:hypothetical protein